MTALTQLRPRLFVVPNEKPRKVETLADILNRLEIPYWTVGQAEDYKKRQSEKGYLFVALAQFLLVAVFGGVVFGATQINGHSSLMVLPIIGCIVTFMLFIFAVNARPRWNRDIAVESGNYYDAAWSGHYTGERGIIMGFGKKGTKPLPEFANDLRKRIAGETYGTFTVDTCHLILPWDPILYVKCRGEKYAVAVWNGRGRKIEL